MSCLYRSRITNDQVSLVTVVVLLLLFETTTHIINRKNITVSEKESLLQTMYLVTVELVFLHLLYILMYSVKRGDLYGAERKRTSHHHLERYETPAGVPYPHSSKQLFFVKSLL